MPIFSQTGGLPDHLYDEAAGIFYIAAAFLSSIDNTETIYAARQDTQGNTLTWADGTTQKVVAASIAAAGRPTLSQNRFDPEQPLILLHGDLKYLGTQGGEVWTALT